MQKMALKYWRQKQGWTQEEAARFLGTTKTSVYRWESGRHHIPQSIEILTRLLEEKINIRKVEKFLQNPLA